MAQLTFLDSANKPFLFEIKELQLYKYRELARMELGEIAKVQDEKRETDPRY